jgi:serine/threonine-protein kinase
MSFAPVLPKAGDVIAGKYRIEKIVGEGGMGVVFAAHHLMLDHRVAVKVLLVDAAHGEEVVERFVREAQAAARVKSDHVVRVMDAGSLDNGLPFLVMEYLEGCDLGELLSLEGPLAFTDVCDYALQVLAALGQAHAAGIVHRDLKPANIFLRARDEGPNLVKILDFGISKQESERARWKELTGHACLGTPAYMSPEQLRSSKNVDPRADLWSLGVVMYELLTGKLPFDGESPGEIFAAILEKTPTPLGAHRSGVPDALSLVVTRALQRDRDARFADAGEFARALVPLGSGRWTHLVRETEQAVGRVRKAATTNTGLVAAAVAAAQTSLRPPSATGTALAFDIALTPTELHLPTSPFRTVRPTRTARARFKLALAVASAPLLVAVALFAHTPARATPARAMGAPLGVEALSSSKAAPVLSVPSVRADLGEDVPPVAIAAPSAFATPAKTANFAPKAPSAPDKRTKGRPSFLKSRN